MNKILLAIKIQRSRKRVVCFHSALKISGDSCVSLSKTLWPERKKYHFLTNLDYVSTLTMGLRSQSVS